MLQKSYVSKSEDGMVKIYWALNGMKQDDPILIEFIRENVLVKPSYASTKGLFINIDTNIVSKPRPLKFLLVFQYLLLTSLYTSAIKILTLRQVLG